MILFDLVSQVQRVASYKLLDYCTFVQFPVMSLDAQFNPNYALLQNNELTCMDRILILLLASTFAYCFILPKVRIISSIP